MWLLLLVACADPLLTEAVSADLGTKLCSLGHPNAECGKGRRVGWAGGACANRDRKDRWVDIAVPYTRKGDDHEMVVRVHLKSVTPCRAGVAVQSDDGPNPVLLDNPITSGIVGEALCNRVSGP
ncbi:MAG: hypothetical protein R3F61_03005 [Myxococcota bacterium]